MTSLFSTHTRNVLSTLCAVFVCLCLVQNAQAQTINIPDANFASAIRSVCPTCIDGSNNLTADAATLSSLNVQSKNISSLAGLEGFTNLQTLNCVSNQLTSLPALPANLRELYCSRNKLASLPTLPATLELLGSGMNQFTSLPALPAKLKTLGCSLNKLTSLPALPTALESLVCMENQLTSLPALPANLFYLDCNTNQLTSLPALPESLESLVCYANPITCLPTLPNSLEGLSVSNTVACIPNKPTNGLFSIFVQKAPNSFEFVTKTLPICDTFNLTTGTTASATATCIGGPAVSFAASASSSGTNLGIKWQRKGATDTDFIDIAGTSASYTSGTTANYTATASLANHNASYRAVFTGTTCALSTNAATIQIHAALSPAATGGSGCVGASIGLTATGGSTYAWAGASGTFNNQSAMPMVSGLAAGGHTFTVTAYNANTGCSGTATANITATTCESTTTTPPVSTNTCAVSIVNKFPAPNSGAKIVLGTDAPKASGYAWRGPAEFSSSNATVTIFRVQTTQAGVYTVTVTTTNNCTATATTQVTVGGVSTAPTTTPPTLPPPPAPPTPPQNTTIPLVIKVDVNNRNPAPNSTVRYAVVVMNPSTNASGSITVSNVLPQGVSFVRGTMGAISEQNGTLTLTAPNVPAGEFVLWLFEANVTGTGKIINTATLSYGGQNLSASIDINVGTNSRLGVGEATNKGMEVRAYPNPSSGKVLVEVRLAEASPLTLQCFDMQGKALLTQILAEESTTHYAEIDLSTWNKGMYLLNAQSNFESQSKKVIKE